MSILSILLLVLKYIGIILGIILFLFFTILTVILFVPVRYSIYLSGVEDIDMDLEVTWFKKILYFHYVMKNSKKSTKTFYLFGRSLLKEKTVQENVKDIPIEEEERSVPLDNQQEGGKYIHHDTENRLSRHINIEEKKKIIEHHKKEAKVITNKKKEARKLENNLSQELEEQVEEKDAFGIKDLLKYPDKKEILLYTYGFIKKLILHIVPKKFYCKVEFGLEDPAHTAYILGGVGIIQSFFGNSVDIKANFNKKIFLGEIRGKGKLLIGIVIKYILEYLLKKPIKQIVMLYLKKRKEDHNGIEFEE